jgi:hypothetical protein
MRPRLIRCLFFMYLSFSTLGFLIAAAVVVWMWHDNLRARDVANAAAMAACERIGLQFLDGTAAFSNLRFIRDSGRLRLRRTFVFDYTSQSIERRQGFAILLGMEVEYVGFAPEHTAQAASIDASQIQSGHSRSAEVQSAQVQSVETDNPPPSPPNTGNNVLDFDAHRVRSDRRRIH